MSLSSAPSRIAGNAVSPFLAICFALSSNGAYAQCPEHSHIKPGTENLDPVVCNCDGGYEKRGGKCEPLPQLEGAGRLTTAMDRAVRNTMEISPGDNGPKAMEARCSEFVRSVSEQLGIDAEFRRGKNGERNANAMAEYVAQSPRWRLVEGRRAQELANQGTFVVGVSPNRSGHGHVAVVAPIPPDTARNFEEPLIRDGNLHHQASGALAHSTYGAVAANKAFSGQVSYYEYMR